MQKYAKNMSEQLKTVESILKKTEQLSKRHAELQSKNYTLSAENKNLNTQIELQSKTIDELRSQLNISKIAKGVAVEDGEKKELKKKVNQYIREIDKCLAMLNA